MNTQSKTIKLISWVAVISFLATAYPVNLFALAPESQTKEVYEAMKRADEVKHPRSIKDTPAEEKAAREGGEKETSVKVAHKTYEVLTGSFSRRGGVPAIYPLAIALGAAVCLLFPFMTLPTLIATGVMAVIGVSYGINRYWSSIIPRIALGKALQLTYVYIMRFSISELILYRRDFEYLRLCVEEENDFFLYILPAVKKQFGGDIEKYWPMLIKISLSVHKMDQQSDFRSVFSNVTTYLKNTKKDMSYLSSNIDSIAARYVELTRAGYLFTALLNSDLSIEQLILRERQISSGIQEIEDGKPFDINDSVDVALNYVILAKELPDKERLSYDDFLKYVSKCQTEPTKAVDIPPENLLQLRALVYEAYKILEKVMEIRSKSARPIVIVANKSYGPFALSPVRRILKNMGVKIVETKMGSTTCHENPYRVSWDKPEDGIYNRRIFIEDEEGAIELFAKERPHVVVVDASYSLDVARIRQARRQKPRYPDAYQGWRNWFIALNEGIRDDGTKTNLVDDFQKSNDFVEELKGDYKLKTIDRGGWEGEFSALVEKANKTGVRVGEKELYHMRFWTPASVKLMFSEATEQSPHGELRAEFPRKFDSDTDLKRPTLLMVESAIESGVRYPIGVGSWINEGLMDDRSPPQEGKNHAAYYDDKDHFNEFRLAYEPGVGVMMSKVYELTGRMMLEDELLPLLKEREMFESYIAGAAVNAEKKEFEACVFDLTGTLAVFKDNIPDAIAERLNVMLRNGVKVAIVTDDTEKDDIKGRVVDRIEPALRRNLSIYLNGGNVLWRFDG